MSRSETNASPRVQQCALTEWRGPTMGARVGVHLLQPDAYELACGVETAERDGYSVVYVYGGFAKGPLVCLDGGREPGLVGAWRPRAKLRLV